MWENIKFNYVGPSNDNESIHELQLIWHSFRDADTPSWITIAYNEDNDLWGISQSNYNVSSKNLKNVLFEFEDAHGVECFSISCENYINNLRGGCYWDAYKLDIIDIASEYKNNKDKINKLIKRHIIDSKI